MASRRKLVLAMPLALVCLAAALAPAAAGAKVSVRFRRIAGFRSPGTPARYDRVGILKTGSPRAKNVLVLNPGTSASAAYFEPLAKSIVAGAKGWQVWAVERRENLLEDQSMLTRAKEGKATGQQLFDYYLGYLTNSSITRHFQPIPDSSVGYARDWGMNTEINDLRRVVLEAEKLGGRVVVGGHSLGGSITTAYATWDFHGQPGAKGLAGLVYIDGASSSTPVTADQAEQSLASLQSGTPWLAFGGIPAPFAGLFQATGSAGALIDPNSPSLGQQFPLLPDNLKPPVPVTNLGQLGYALDVKTSPASLVAAQAHLGKLAASGSPRGWDGRGALTPIKRYAEMFSGAGLKNLDGAAWYHPLRLTIDAGAVANGNANPAQQVLDVHTTEGHKLPKSLRIYAFGAALGGPGVPKAAEALAKQSGIPRRNLVLVNRRSSYAHNDPAGASPKRNLFLEKLVPFLRGIARR
ncbi:MAG TPA: alpha/beta hydrolase [Thermoleophilaceae bacterium]